MKAQQKKLSGCASNLLAPEDLGHLRKPIVGIYKPSSIIKIPTSIWKWQNKRLSIIKIMVLLWSTSVEKRIVALPLFYLFFGPFFIWPFSFFRDNALWMMIITLLFIYISMITTRYYNKVWLYMNASGGVPGWAMNQEWHVWNNMHGGFAKNTMSTTWSCKAIWQ